MISAGFLLEVKKSKVRLNLASSDKDLWLDGYPPGSILKSADNVSRLCRNEKIPPLSNVLLDFPRHRFFSQPQFVSLL